MDRIGFKARAITCYHAPQTCTACRGAGGAMQTETSGGKTLQSWKNCSACNGTGQR